MGKLRFIIFLFIININIYSEIDIINPNVILLEPIKEFVIKDTTISFNIPYYEIIKENVEKYSLKHELVLGIIKTESNYQQYARSKANAIGLMQVVGESAGAEVWEFLYGYYKIPEDSLLYIPEHNINFGCAYLYRLKTFYFGNINDSVSRRYCIIAAYNTGPSNLIKAFVSYKDIVQNYNIKEYNKLSKEEKFKVRLNIAVDKINKINSYRVKYLLKHRLPYYETVVYLDRVLKNMRQYEKD